MPAPEPPPPDLDPELLHRAQAGDEAAFGAIMRAHYERTFRLVYAILRHEADARDVCQEIWLTVWRELPRFRGGSRFTTWLHPIATRRALDQLRRRRRWFDRFLPFGSDPDTVAAAPESAATDDARESAEASERTGRLRRVLDSLPPKLRAVLALRELEGLSYEEIAQAASIPTGTVMSRLHHARRLLAQKLKDRP
ncbi:MAG: sigma-70 family RNA polymerase sigma factor [Opitutaceae bacterium]|nr:sigma-70 family RNA polymerase sigma factor [Opitutaceae bacterium]